jgi:hypothetical protein
LEAEVVPVYVEGANADNPADDGDKDANPNDAGNINIDADVDRDIDKGCCSTR